MARDHLEDHIREQIAEADGKPAEPSDDAEADADVAIQTLVCAECGTVNGREPRPTNVPDIKTECPECGEVTVHEYRVDSDVTHIEASENIEESDT